MTRRVLLVLSVLVLALGSAWYVAVRDDGGPTLHSRTEILCISGYHVVGENPGHCVKNG